jgi:hypothetical protein
LQCIGTRRGAGQERRRDIRTRGSEYEHSICPADAMQRNSVGVEVAGLKPAFQGVVVRFVMMAVEDAFHLHGACQIINHMKTMLVT